MKTSSEYWDNIPVEFRRGGWAVASMQGDAPKQPLHPLMLQPLSTSLPAGGVSDSGRMFPAWSTFDAACAAAAGRPGWQIGKLLWADDGFVVLDLDDMSGDPDLTPDDVNAIQAYQQRLLDEAFPLTYAELSVSGKGLHAIYKARLAGGRHPSGEYTGGEIYGHARFILTTGRVWRGAPIAEAQMEVDRLVEALDKAGGSCAFTEDELAGLHLSPEQVQALVEANKQKRHKFLSLHRQGYASPYARALNNNRSSVDMAWAHLVARAEPSFDTFLELFRAGALWRVDAYGRVDKPGYHSERQYVDNYVRRTWQRAVGRRAALKQHAAMRAEEGRKLVARMTVNGKRIESL